MLEDAELIHRYVKEGSQPAFTELVERHINLVYAVALRRACGDTHRAEDITQQVFTALAQNAGKLLGRPVLTGWLHTTTRNVTIQLIRSEQRRAKREESFAMQESENGSPAAAAWEQLRPVIDDVLDELSERDREAVMLRYFESKSFGEIGTRLQLSENSARMRIERALDKMHGLLSKRGLKSTVGALALTLTQQPGVAAPAGLAATVSAAALDASTAVVTSASIGAGIYTFMATSKLVLPIAGVITAIAIGVAIERNSAQQRTQLQLNTAHIELKTTVDRLKTAELRLREEKAHARSAQADSEALLAAMDGLQAKPKETAKAPITKEEVDRRYRRAQELVRTGNWEAALPELLWCYDEGMVRIPEYGGVRISFLVSEITRIAPQFPQALEALKERRDRAERQMLDGLDVSNATREIAALNNALGENERNLEIFDALALDDSRRANLGRAMSDQLLEAKRYDDVVASTNYDRMLSQFESSLERALPARSSNLEGVTAQSIQSRYLVTTTAKNIEALAGAGKLVEARALANKLLAYDNNETTRALLTHHLSRAGQPDLLTKSTNL